MLNFFKKYTIIFLSALLLILSSCDNRIGSCTDDPGEGSTTVSAKTINIFSNNSKDLWQTQLADWQDTPYYTNGQDITVSIGTGNYGSVDAHRGQSGRVTHPCNICSKIVKYASNGKIEYQTPNCICGPKIYGPTTQTTQSFQYDPTARGEFRAIETIQPQCEIMPGYLEQAHYGIINANERFVCKKGDQNKIIQISNNTVEVATITPPSSLLKSDINNSQQYTCIPMEWALNLGGVDNLGRPHPNFTTDSHIQSFLGANILRNHLGVEKYYSKATYLLTADFKNITADVGGVQQSGYEIVHFPVDYYEKELSQTESDKAKITQLKDVNYHQVNNCNASNGLSLYMGLFPTNSDMPGYNNKIYAYHLYSFNQMCRSYYRGICNNAVTEFKLKSLATSSTTATSSGSASSAQPSSVQTQILPTFFSTDRNNLTPASIPAGYKVKFKIYDNYYTDNNSSDGYLVNIASGIQTQNTDNQQQDEGIIGNAKNKIDSIFIGARDQTQQDIRDQTQQDITEIINSAKKNGLIRATYENFTRKNQLLIRLVMSLFLLFYAVSYLMGLSEMNQKELVVRVFKIAIVFAFLDPALVGITNERPNEYTKTTSLDPSNPQYTTNNYATLGFLLYQKYVVNFVLDGLNTLTNIVSGLSQQVIAGFTANDGADALQREGISFSQNVNFAYFDKILEKIFNIKTVGSIISAFFTKLVVGALLLVVFLFFLVKTIFKLLVTYILNWLQIILALSLGPIFFLFLLFSRTKSFFTKWLAFVFARGLDIVILLALTFPFLSVIYDDLLLLIGQPACLKAIGPSFLRIGVWFQGDSVNDDLNNFFGYMFALARDIALVYMVSLIASYAPKISGKIINIAEQQNTAEMSSGATKIASETTAEALKGIAASIKFANQSYVGGMTKSYLKQGALGVSDFIGTTRLAKFAKNTAVSTAQFAKNTAASTAQQAFKGFNNVVNAKNAKTAGTKLFDTAFGTNFSKQKGGASADASAGATAGSTSATAAGSGAAGTPASSAGGPSVSSPTAGGIPVSSVSSNLDAIPTEPKASKVIPFAPIKSSGANAGGIAPAGGVPADATADATAGAGTPATGAGAFTAGAGTPATGAGGSTGSASATTSTGGATASGASFGAPTGGVEDSLPTTKGKPVAYSPSPPPSPLSETETDTTPRPSNLFGVNYDPLIAKVQSTHTTDGYSVGSGDVVDDGKGVGLFGDEEFDAEARIRPSKIIVAKGKHGSAPPLNDSSSVQPNKAEPANDQLKPAFLEKIKSTVQDGLKSLQETISNDLLFNKVLDLFIESQNEKLRYLNAQFGQSGEESDIEKELQKAFEKFKQDFTSTKTEFSQSQTTQITKYQQEAEKLKNDINSNQLKPEQKEKLIVLATQNNQQDLAKKLEEQPTKLEKPQQKQLIKLVEQDLFAKQESQLVPKITKVIIDNDNHSRVSDITKQQVFNQVADKLKPSKTIPETIKQEVLKKFATQLDDKNLDTATKQIITELKKNPQQATNNPAKQQILVRFLADKSKPQQAKEVVLKTLESIANAQDEGSSTKTPQERRNFFNEIKKEVAKEEILEKFVNQLNGENLDPATKQIITELKTELQKATNIPAQQQQILVKFLANNKSPEAKEAVLEMLESIEAKDSPQQKQARQDFINEVKITTLATQLQDTKPSVSEKQKILVQFLADRTNATATAKVEEILQKIKEETEKEEEKIPLKQERTDFIAKVEEQTIKVETFAQHYNSEPKSDGISQEEKEILQKSKLFKDLDIEYLEYLIENNEKYDEILKDASLYGDNDNFIQHKLQKLSQDEKQNLQEYLEKREELLEKLLKTDWKVDLSTSVEAIETQKKAFNTLLKLLGIKYHDREKCLSILFATQDTSLSMTDQIEKRYANLERPLDKMQRHDVLLEKILTAINEDIQKELQSSKNAKEDAITEKKRKQIEKNQLTIKKLQLRRKSFKSLFARIANAIAKS